MGIFGNSKVMKVFAVVLILVTSVTCVFATELRITSSVGDAKVYNSDSRAVKNPSSLGEGWVLRTFQSSIEISNGEFTMEISAGSLLKVTSLGADPVIYLLDGRAQATTEDSRLVINTTVSSYIMDRNSGLGITTTQASEDCIIGAGNAIVIDGITGRKTEMKATSEQATVETQTEIQPETKTESMIETQIEAPVVEQQPTPTAQHETPEIQTATEETAPAVLRPFEKTFSYGSFEATVTAYVGTAYIDYPSYVTDDEIAAAALAAYNAYPQYMDGIFFRVLEPGRVQLTYPQTYGQAEFDLAIALLEKELPPYIDSIIAAAQAEQVVETASDEPAAVVDNVEAESQEITQPYAFSRTFSYGSFEATVTAYVGTAYIDYPSYVTDDEIAAAALAAYNAYPQYMDGIFFRVLEPGRVQLTYPQTYGQAEFDLAIALLEKELPAYLASLMPVKEQVIEEPVVEVEAVVAVEQEMIPAAVEQPAAPETKEETPSEPQQESVTEVPVEVEQPVVEQEKEEQPAATEPEQQKTRSWGFSTYLVYGVNSGNVEYRNLPLRTGIFSNSLEISIDPYIKAGLWKFALHIGFNTSDVEGTIRPTSAEGITGIANKIARYIGEISYAGDSFSFRIDRYSDIDLPSAAFASFERDHDRFQRLSAVATLKNGRSTVMTFADDLQMNSKLNGGSQFAGVTYTFGSESSSVSASLIADFGKGTAATVLYQTIDADFVLSNGSLDLDIIVSAMARKSLKEEGIALGGSAVMEVGKGAFSLGAGAAYNRGGHIYNSISNSPVSVIGPTACDSVDIILKAGINTEHFALNGYANAPLALGGNGRLAYQTVRTRSGATAETTADTMNIRMDIMVGRFTFSAGMQESGFTGRLADFAKAMIKGSSRRNGLKGLLDPEISSIFGKVSFSLENFDIFARAELADIGGRTISLSFGGRYTF